MEKIITKSKEEFKKVLNDKNKIYMGCEIYTNTNDKSKGTAIIFYEEKK